MSALEPEDLLYSQLLLTFSPSIEIGPGQVVYHAPPGQDPTDAYVVYRRVNSSTDRAIDGSSGMRLVEIEVSVAAMFFAPTIITMPDNWTDFDANGNLWYFTLLAQSQDAEPFNEVFTYECCTAA